MHGAATYDEPQLPRDEPRLPLSPPTEKIMSMTFHLSDRTTGPESQVSLLASPIASNVTDQLQFSAQVSYVFKILDDNQVSRRNTVFPTSD